VVATPPPLPHDRLASYPSDLPGLAYADDVKSFASNEICINWNAPLVFLSIGMEAILSPDGLPSSVPQKNLESIVPHGFALYPSYPNPFNPSTTISYGLPAQSRVRLQIYNILGQAVADLVNTEQAAGWNQVVWNANVASGLYFYRLEAVAVSDPNKRFVDVKKMILIK
jgi:hypothetical protein